MSVVGPHVKVKEFEQRPVGCVSDDFEVIPV
jgi:hypothetical protein